MLVECMFVGWFVHYVLICLQIIIDIKYINLRLDTQPSYNLEPLSTDQLVGHWWPTFNQNNVLANHQFFHNEPSHQDFHC